MNDFHDDEDDDQAPSIRRRDTPTGRTYVHKRCGGQTHVSGGDYSHICDPFWPCTSTYCCTCAGFAPLHEVRWEDTGEPVSQYRSRMRSETPGLIQAWRYGLGFLAGGAVGALVGLLAMLVTRVPQNRLFGFVLTGALIGAAIFYLVGTFVLNRLFNVDYRRMR